MQDIRVQFEKCPQCEGKPHRYYNEPKQRLSVSKPKLPTFHDLTYRDAYCLTCKGNGTIRVGVSLKPKLYFETTLLQESRSAIVTSGGEISTEEYIRVMD